MDTTTTTTDASLVPLEVRGLINDPLTNTPIVILAKKDGDAFLPIWIGLFEANAIALEIEDISTPRPMTHDLVVSILEGAGHFLQRIIINALEDNVFRASLQLSSPQGTIWHVDARPSDAVALALRTDAGIFATPEVLGRAQMTASKNEEDAIRLFLEHLRPQDLGKYQM